MNDHHPNIVILSENVDIEMRVCDKHANEHWAMKQLGGDFTHRKLKTGPSFKNHN